jgi:hypothetical protein
MKKHLVLLTILGFCLQFTGSESICANDISPDLAIINVEPIVWGYGWGQSVLLKATVQNLSHSHPFNGNLYLNMYRNIPVDEEYQCGGMQHTRDTYTLTLLPKEEVTLSTLYSLCRPGNYPIRLEVSSYPIDPVERNDVFEKTYEYIWKETVDLRFSNVKGENSGYVFDTRNGSANIKFDIDNTGNAPVIVPINQQLATVMLRYPDGTTSKREP